MTINIFNIAVKATINPKKIQIIFLILELKHLLLKILLILSIYKKVQKNHCLSSSKNKKIFLLSIFKNNNLAQIIKKNFQNKVKSFLILNTS